MTLSDLRESKHVKNNVKILFLLSILLLSASEVFCMPNSSDSTASIYNGRNEVYGLTAEQTFKDVKTVALAKAACKGDIETMARLIKQGADPNAKDVKNSINVLGWAIECEDVEGIEALLKAEADPNTRLIRIGPGGAPYSYTPVCRAAEMYNPKMLKMLLKYKGDPNAVFGGGNSALWVAFTAGAFQEQPGWDNYYSLLNAGVDINRRYRGETIAETASGHYAKIAELLERGYNNRLDHLGWQLERSGWLDENADLYKDPSNLENHRLALKVKAMLEERGVKFPVPISARDMLKEFAEEDVRRAENAKKPGGELMNP